MDSSDDDRVQVTWRYLLLCVFGAIIVCLCIAAVVQTEHQEKATNQPGKIIVAIGLGSAILIFVMALLCGYQSQSARQEGIAENASTSSMVGLTGAEQPQSIAVDLNKPPSYAKLDLQPKVLLFSSDSGSDLETSGIYPPAYREAEGTP